nr:hypothetical protein [Variovorax sp. SRS16]
MHRLARRKPEREGRAFARRRAHLDIAAMRSGDFLDDEQAEPDAACRGLSFRAPHHGLEKGAEQIRRDRFALVVNHHRGRRTFVGIPEHRDRPFRAIVTAASTI